ncbi:MAG: hypothetical protein COB84_00425 [Rhodobacteraceae bacterium]|nr:MAG: hypothetical protein COB84_00425 [Paracoccaceae bacterium]
MYVEPLFVVVPSKFAQGAKIKKTDVAVSLRLYGSLQNPGGGGMETEPCEIGMTSVFEVIWRVGALSPSLLLPHPVIATAIETKASIWQDDFLIRPIERNTLKSLQFALLLDSDFAKLSQVYDFS